MQLQHTPQMLCWCFQLVHKISRVNNFLLVLSDLSNEGYRKKPTAASENHDAIISQYCLPQHKSSTKEKGRNWAVGLGKINPDCSRTQQRSLAAPSGRRIPPLWFILTAHKSAGVSDKSPRNATAGGQHFWARSAQHLGGPHAKFDAECSCQAPAYQFAVLSTCILAPGAASDLICSFSDTCKICCQQTREAGMHQTRYNSKKHSK